VTATTTGRLAVVGLGPGADQFRSPEASARLAAASDLVGYGPYLQLVEHDTTSRPGAVRHEFDNREEAQRARFALDLAASGRDVVVVSSGDPGVFAMATAVVEELHHAEHDRYRSVELSIVPGITAATAAAARVGAPLGHDFCVISLSDVLKPWSVVERRLEAAVGADFAVAIYNPASKQRPWQFGRALEIISAHREPSTPVVVARDVGRPAEQVDVTTLGALDPAQIDMRTIVIVGSTTTRTFHDAHERAWVYTPRAYPGDG
jgi:cobalt-precorrin 5A hydrolase/precorrin-3B C17-methyltransferase